MALLQSVKLPIGWQAPDFDLPAVDGKNYNLEYFSNRKGLVIIFTCNHCPYAKASWPILIQMARNYQEKGIGFAAINSNDEQAYPEDSFEEMKKKAEEWNIPFPYLRDESQSVAHQYQAQCTPDIYVFDEDRRLYYHGRINDNWQEPEKVTKHDLQEALENLLAGKSSLSEQFPSMGCSIKWKE